MTLKKITIEAWGPDSPRWQELVDLITAEGQGSWLEFQADWHMNSHMLVAVADGQLVGFLRFVVQVIGVEEDHQPVMFNGQVLTEAKVINFGTAEPYRRNGIGRMLQVVAVERARQLGCYQFRSFSDGDHEENHQLKLAMGFAVQPVLREGDDRAAYFILPLQSKI